MGNINPDIARREQWVSSHEQAASFLSTAIEKWWVHIPARLDRCSSLLSDAWADGMYLTAWPWVAMLPLLSLILGVVEGVGHFKFLSIWDVGMSYGPAYVFAQSLPLVIIAAFVGTLSADAGLMLVLGYVLGDYLLAGAPWVYRYNTFVPTFHPRTHSSVVHLCSVLCFGRDAYSQHELFVGWPQSSHIGQRL